MTTILYNITSQNSYNLNWFWQVVYGVVSSRTQADNSIVNWGRLFSYNIFAEKAECLPPEERKAYAEKVAMSFWTAIGGSDDEIDLGDSDRWILSFHLIKY